MGKLVYAMDKQGEEPCPCHQEENLNQACGRAFKELKGGDNLSLSLEEIERRVCGVIDEYFQWIIYIPDPKATCENLKKKIKVALNPNKYVG